jgi:enediyne biosynthesis protein E4
MRPPWIQIGSLALALACVAAGSPRAAGEDEGKKGRAALGPTDPPAVSGAERPAVSDTQRTTGSRVDRTSQLLLEDVARQAGIDFHLTAGSSDKLHIPEAVGGGLALLDLEGDGDLDLYLVNAGTLESETGAEPKPFNHLYRNDGPGPDGIPRFTDVTERSGTGDRTWGMGAVSADVDGDGDVDLYVTNYGPNRLYLNDGTGRFKEVGEVAGVADARMSTGATLGDVDGDGDLDLFVANYVNYDIVAAGPKPKLCDWRGLRVFCGPRGLQGAGDSFYRNLGAGEDGTVRFQDASEEAGLADREGYYGFTPTFADFNQDGHLDLYVANDVTPNYLYLNDGAGRFREVAPFHQAAFDEHGREQGSMGLEVADYDADGLDDVLVTNFSHDTHTLYRNRGDHFDDVTYETGLGQLTLAALGWGVGLHDLDLDGDRDYFLAHGHTYPQVEGAGLSTDYAQLDMVLLWDGKRFTLAPERGGLAARRVSRGSVFGDLDNDGDMDIVVQHLDDRPALLLNRTPRLGHHYLGVALQAPGPNTKGIGARVRLVAGDLELFWTVRAGGSHISGNDSRLLFGLGTRLRVDRLEIRWPDGLVQTLEGIKADARLTIRRGEGVVERVEP